jgi:protein SCO1/2
MRRPALPAILILLAAMVVGCARPGDRAERAQSDAASYGLRGRVLPGPLPKPDLVLTDVNGAPFDLRRETDGYLTLLFFGYTSCPDICPIHMANLGAVLRTFRPTLRERIRVVFVTTDPDRDTPARMKAWLANFDPTFIGLTGDTATINAAQRALYLPPAQIGPADSTGAYLVGHAAAIVAFTPDNQARAMYPFGIRQADWANDLPRLLEIEWAE